MDKELSRIEGVKCCMDVILVIGRDQAEHDQRLKQVLDRLVVRNFMLNLDKGLFSQTRLQYLGQIIDREEIRKDPSKVKAITDMAGHCKPETFLRIGQPPNEILLKPG